MARTQTIARIGQNDFRLFSRDSFLVMITGYIIFLGFLFRFGLPWLDATLLERGVTFSLATYYPMFIAYIAVWNGSLIGGVLVGFLLLEEREDGTIRAMLVTPLPVSVYLAYRVIMPILLGALLVGLQLLILNGLAPLPLPAGIVISAGAGLTAPIMSLFFASFAQNKVQGFALMKFVGVGGIIIGGAWFVGTPLQYLFGLFPPYWVSKAYWLALDGVGWWPLSLAVGVVMQLALVWWLMRRFNYIIHRESA